MDEHTKKPEKKPASKTQTQQGEFRGAIAFFSQVAIMMFASVLIGVFLGRFLDNLLGTSPWLLLICSFLGVGAAFKSLFDLASRK